MTAEDRQPVADARGNPPRRVRRSCAAPPSARLLGILPGGGAVLSSFAAYTLEKKVSQITRPEFGTGRGRRRRRAGSGQQRRRANLVHSAADARHPVNAGDGADDGRDD